MVEVERHLSGRPIESAARPFQWANKIVEGYAARHGFPTFTVHDQFSSLFDMPVQNKIISVRVHPKQETGNKTIAPSYICEIFAHEFPENSRLVSSFYFRRKKQLRKHLGRVFNTLEYNDFVRNSR